MTWSIISINWLDLGEIDKGHSYFERNFGNVKGDFKVVLLLGGLRVTNPPIRLMCLTSACPSIFSFPDSNSKTLLSNRIQTSQGHTSPS